MTREEFKEKWLDPDAPTKKTQKQFMKDLDSVIYTVAMDAVKKADAEMTKKECRC